MYSKSMKLQAVVVWTQMATKHRTTAHSFLPTPGCPEKGEKKAEVKLGGLR